MTSSTLGSIVGLGVDLILCTIFYKWYKTINRSADEIKVDVTVVNGVDVRYTWVRLSH